MSEIVEINVDLIVPNKNQPRLEFYDESIQGLAESIKNNGLLQPISVRKSGDQYEIIAGERRFRACKLIGYEKVPAIIYDYDDARSADLALIENLQREDLNAVEQAMAMQHIMNSANLTQAQLASRLGYKQSTVANKLRLLKLPSYVKQAVAEGTLTERHARALLKVSGDQLESVYQTVVKRNYTVAKTEEYITELSKRGNRGVTNDVLIGINTIKQAYELCQKAGMDCDLQQSDYADNVKLTIRFKKGG